MKRWMVLLVGLLVVAGCSGAEGAAEPEATVPGVSQRAEGERGSELAVVAEAAIEPVRWSELVSPDGGTVAAVLVAEGDRVAEGDLLVQLDAVDRRLAVEEAKAAVAAAEAQLAQVQAGPRPEEIAAARHQVDDATAALSQTAAQRDQLSAGITAAEVAASQAELAQARAELRGVEEMHRKESKSKDAQAREQASYQLHAARQAVAAAEANLEAARDGAGARLRDAGAGVRVAAAQRDVAQAELDLLQAGASAEDVAVAEATVQHAQAGLAMAQVALERTEIRAPLAGTVTQVTVEEGEMAAPGAVVVVLADLDQLQVRTTDLTELDVARVAVGQPAAVTVDGLPGVRLAGHVARIGLRSEDYRGDVVYPVYVELDEDAPGLRWGMTTLAVIETE